MKYLYLTVCMILMSSSLLAMEDQNKAIESTHEDKKPHSIKQFQAQF